MSRAAMEQYDWITGAAPTAAQIILACLRPGKAALLERCRDPRVDWAQIAELAWQHRVTSLVLQALQWSGAVRAGYVPADVLDTMREQRRRRAAQALKLNSALGALLPAFRAAGVPLIVLKGVTLARYYPPGSLRSQTDIDLLVKPADWEAADGILSGLGYRLLEADIVRRPLPSAVQAPDDRQYSHPTGGLGVELHVDFLSTGLLRAEDAAVWRRLEVVEINGLRVPALSAGDAYLAAATHLQRHGYVQLRWFYDIYLLLRAAGRDIDWAAVARQAEQAGVKTAAYFALSYVEALFGRVAPPMARQALRPNALRRRLHEGMWPRRRIIAMEDEPALLLEELESGGAWRPWRFDAYAPPLQMAAHFLLSGNVWPKLGCLGRRYLPREEWLRYHGPRQVGLFRTRLLLARLIEVGHRAARGEEHGSSRHGGVAR